MRSKQRIQVSVHPLTWILAIISFITGQFIPFFLLMLLIVIHELGHVLFHEKKPFVEFGKYREDKNEKEADDFASETLIPEKDFSDFVDKGISSVSIIKFAKQMDIHPSIVVGRLQSRGIIQWNRFNELKVRYVWRDE